MERKKLSQSIKFNMINKEINKESKKNNSLKENICTTPLVTVPNNTPTPIDIFNDDMLNITTTQYIYNSKKNNFLLPPLQLDIHHHQEEEEEEEEEDNKPVSKHRYVLNNLNKNDETVNVPESSNHHSLRQNNNSRNPKQGNIHYFHNIPNTSQHIVNHNKVITLSLPSTSITASSSSTTSSIQSPFTTTNNQNFQNFDGGKNHFNKSNNDNNNNKNIQFNYSIDAKHSTTTNYKRLIHIPNTTSSFPSSSSSTPLYQTNNHISLNPQQLHLIKNQISTMSPHSLIGIAESKDDKIPLTDSPKEDVITPIPNNIDPIITTTNPTTTSSSSKDNKTATTTTMSTTAIHVDKEIDTWDNSKRHIFKTDVFPKPLNALGNDNLMKSDVLNTISTITSNVSNARGINDSHIIDKIEITPPEKDDELLFNNYDNRRISRDEHGLDIISTASLVASSLPSSSSSASADNNKINDKLKDNDNNNPMVSKEDVNSRFSELRQRLLKNPKTIDSKDKNQLKNSNTIDSKDKNQLKKPEIVLLDTAAEVLSNLRSSPFKISDRRSSSFSIPFSSNPGSNPQSASGNNNTTTNNNLMTTANVTNGNLYVSTIKSRPHSASFSSALKPHTRPILRIHQKEDSIGKKLVNHSAISSGSSSDNETEDEKEKGNSITRAGETLSKLAGRRLSMDVIPQKDRNVTWNKNGKRIVKTPQDNDSTKENVNDNNKSKSNNVKKVKKPEVKRKKGRPPKVGRGRKPKSETNITTDEIDPNATDEENVTKKPKKEKATSGATRSRTGCWICRLRKKKCTEEKPKCFNCERLNLDCCYSILRPDFVTDERLRKAKLQEIKINTREAKRKAMKKRSGSGSDTDTTKPIPKKIKKQKTKKKGKSEVEPLYVSAIPFAPLDDPDKTDEEFSGDDVSIATNSVEKEKKDHLPGVTDENIKTFIVRTELQDKLPSPSTTESNFKLNRKELVIKPVEVIVDPISNKKTVKQDD